MSTLLDRLDAIAEWLETEPEEGRYKVAGIQVELEEEKVEHGLEESTGGWSVLASRIYREASYDGFIGAIIYGKLRSGKSMYTLKVAQDLLARMGKRSEYEHIINTYLFFDIVELLYNLKRADYENKLPLLIWDDAGVYGSSYLWFTDKKAYMAIGRVIQVLATRVYALLASTPLPDFILKPLRSVDNYFILVKRIDKTYSKAIGYEMEILPSGKLITRRVFEDTFKRRIPDKAYKLYVALRDSYVDITIDMLEEVLSKRRKKHEKKEEQEEEEDIEVILLPPSR